MIGVPLPAGAKSIELEFTSPAYERGKMITLLAVAAVSEAQIPYCSTLNRSSKPPT